MGHAGPSRAQQRMIDPPSSRSVADTVKDTLEEDADRHPPNPLGVQTAEG